MSINPKLFENWFQDGDFICCPDYYEIKDDNSAILVNIDPESNLKEDDDGF